MKVIAINGSPRKGGNVSQCLDVMAAEFAKEGIEFEVLQPGPRVHPCMACYHCLNEGDVYCIQKDDMVNEIIDKCIEADGIILTSPVYHGGIAGGIVLGYIWQFVFNNVLINITKVSWLVRTKTAMLASILVYVWQYADYIIIFLLFLII